MSLRGLRFAREHAISVNYKNMRMDCGYRLDFLVEDRVVVEVKAIESLQPIHDAQLLSYMKLGGWKLGLLLNFNVHVLTQGVRRRVLGLKERELSESRNHS